MMVEASREAPVPRAATLVRRLLGYGIDICLLFLFVAGTQALLFLTSVHPYGDALSRGPQPPSTRLHLWVMASTTLPFAAYFTIAAVTQRGATLGQRMLGLRVAGKSGGRPGIKQAMIRALVLLVPFEVNHAVMFHLGPWTGAAEALFFAGIGLVWLLILLYLLVPLVRADRRSLHDLASATIVLRAPPGAESRL